MDLSTWRAIMSGERPAPDWLAADNGFASVRAMREAHAPIAAAVRTVTAGARYNIIDLGCGNGALLAASCGETPGLEPLGVERDPRKLIHAQAMFGPAVSRWLSCDMFACPAPLEKAADQSVILIMPGRLLEAGADRAAALCLWLRDHADIILCYAYPDWIARYGSLDELGRRAGFASWESVGPNRTIAIGRLP
ncbi:hypothetical protein ACRAVF_28000 [Bradyrhizobium oligotrophicum S58]